MAETELAALAKPMAVVMWQRPSAVQSIAGYSGLRPGSLIFCVNFSPSSHGLASSPNMVMTITFGLMVSGSLAKAGALASIDAAEAARARVRMDRFMEEASLSDRTGRCCASRIRSFREAFPLPQSFACRYGN